MTKFEDLLKETLSSQSTDIVDTNSEDVKLQNDTITTIIEQIAQKYKITETLALKGIFLLFLKGAANKNTPFSLKVTVLNEEGQKIQMAKDVLFYEYQFITKNTYLRRFAKTIATEISKFAELNKLDGDLARKINTNLLVKNDKTLDIIERAWCSSFNYNNPDIYEYPQLERIPTLLAQDLLTTRQPTTTSPRKTQKKSSARTKGPGKKNKGGQKKKGK